MKAISKKIVKIWVVNLVTFPYLSVPTLLILTPDMVCIKISHIFSFFRMTNEIPSNRGGPATVSFLKIKMVVRLSFFSCDHPRQFPFFFDWFQI